jgi:hypothetical protein
VSIRATSQIAATTPLNSHANLGSPRAICTARTRAVAPGGATARIIPAIIWDRDPNRTGVA